MANGPSHASRQDICGDATAFQEQKYNIPKNLLRAISLAESGRWDSREKANFTWPWTVMAEGRGRYLPNRSAAIREVRDLQARGVKNIDVGCMQVNLHFHPDAFASLNDAFDPRRNAEYAAQFLTRLMERTGSWTAAAGHYHSGTLDRGMRYREKVIGFWNESNRRDVKLASLERERAAPGQIKLLPVDRDRTELLNNAFRKRMGAHQKALAKANAIARGQSLQERYQAQTNSPALNAARQRAFRDRKQKQLLFSQKPSRELSGLVNRPGFAQNRRRQLDEWRAKVADPSLMAGQEAAASAPLPDNQGGVAGTP